MAISSSSEIIRDMKKNVQMTMNDIEKTQIGIRKAASATQKWSDAQGQQYRELLKRIAVATASPTRTLSEAIPKLEGLAQSLDAYSKVRF